MTMITGGEITMAPLVILSGATRRILIEREGGQKDTRSDDLVPFLTSLTLF